MKYIKAFVAEQLYAAEFPCWPTGCPFGNLDVKYMFLTHRMNILNETIKEIVELDRETRGLEKQRKHIPFEISGRSKILKLRFCSELKICTDEFISLISILGERKNLGTWPRKIKIDSIGALVKDDFTQPFESFKRFKPLLDKINTLGNAIKHSFVNSETHWNRSHIPTSHLMGFYNRYNNLDKGEIKMMRIQMDSFIEEFNELLSCFKNRVRKFKFD